MTIFALILTQRRKAMNKQEIVKLLLIIKGTYPNHFNRIDDEETSKLTIEMWHSAFKDQDFLTVFKCTQKHILQKTFPPTIAELREEVIKVTNKGAIISPEVAWEKVILGVKKYGYYRQSEAFETFSEPIRKAVKAIGWQNICMSENIGIERSNFFKMFNALDQENREEALLPKEIYHKLQELTHQKELEQGSNEVSKM